ncbi:MAG: hypothetical protein MZV63_67515 [Marinilabiliales bacterium]|nr:hypothetical protein [Marinilabiliales bacterium]
MDTKVAEKDLIRIRQILDQFIDKDINYHALYTRQAASKRFISFHLLVPGDFTVNKAHEFTKTIEYALTKEYAYSDIFIHLEPFDDPDALDDLLSEMQKPDRQTTFGRSNVKRHNLHINSPLRQETNGSIIFGVKWSIVSAYAIGHYNPVKNLMVIFHFCLKSGTVSQRIGAHSRINDIHP